jgi:hypothetical protein
MRQIGWLVTAIVVVLAEPTIAGLTTRPAPPTRQQLRQIEAARAMVRPSGPVTIAPGVGVELEPRPRFAREYDHYRFAQLAVGYPYTWWPCAWRIAWWR